MFDVFVPHPPMRCTECDTSLTELHGKDGPCEQLVWEQGRGHPVRQGTDDALPEADLLRFSLPSRFAFYGACSRCKHWTEYTGVCEGGTWVRSILGLHADLSSPVRATRVANGWRQCSGCTDAWAFDESERIAGCPHCGALTRLE